MLCTVCGTLNDDRLQICSKCGNNMTFHTQEHYEFHEVNNQQLNYQQTNYQNQPNYQQPNYQNQANYQPQGNQQTGYRHQQYQQTNYQNPQHQHPNYQQGAYQQNAYYATTQRNDPGKLLGIIGFALSMASIVMSNNVMLCIAGIILSAIGLKKSKEAGFNNVFAKAGLISGIIITVLFVLFIVFFIILYVFAFIMQSGPSSL